MGYLLLCACVMFYRLLYTYNEIRSTLHILPYMVWCYSCYGEWLLLLRYFTYHLVGGYNILPLGNLNCVSLAMPLQLSVTRSTTSEEIVTTAGAITTAISCYLQIHSHAMNCFLLIIYQMSNDETRLWDDVIYIQ